MPGFLPQLVFCGKMKYKSCFRILKFYLLILWEGEGDKERREGEVRGCSVEGEVPGRLWGVSSRWALGSLRSGFHLTRSQLEFYALFATPVNKMNSKVYSKFFIHYHPSYACT